MDLYTYIKQYTRKGFRADNTNVNYGTVTHVRARHATDYIWVGVTKSPIMALATKFSILESFTDSHEPSFEDE
jgi:hypothetical protein